MHAQACVHELRSREDDNVTMMKYEGYEASVKYDEDAEIFHGEVIDLRDVITFQSRSKSELKEAFAASVEVIWLFPGNVAKNRSASVPPALSELNSEAGETPALRQS